MNNLKDNYILNNITASSEMKQELFQACKGQKHSHKITFLYSKQIAVAGCALVFAMGGLTVHAAVTRWQDRMAAMSQEDVVEYQEIVNQRETELQNRDMTQEEHNRQMALLEEYRGGRYPEQSLTIVNSSSEVSGDGLCYVKETGILHLPESTLTDEELLEIIDYKEKANYVNGGIATSDEPVNDYQKGLSEADTEKAKTIALDALKKYFGYDASSSAECMIYTYSSYVEGEYQNYFDVAFSSDELASTVSWADIDFETGEAFSVSLGGWGKYYQTKNAAEIEANMDNYVAAAESFLNQYFPESGASKTVQYRLMGDTEAETLMILFEREQGYYMVEVSAFDSSIVSFNKFKSRAGYEDQLDAVEYKIVK